MAAPQIEHAFALMTRGDAAQAANVLSRLLRDAPAYAPGHVLYAQACEALHRWPDALSAWQTVSLLMPDLDMARAGVLRSTRVIATLRSMAPTPDAEPDPDPPTAPEPSTDPLVRTPPAPRPTPSPSGPAPTPSPLTWAPEPPSQSEPTARTPAAPPSVAAPMASLRPIRLGDYATPPPSAAPRPDPAPPAAPTALPPALPDHPVERFADDLPLPPPPPGFDTAPKPADIPFASRLADAFRSQSFDDDGAPEPTAPGLPTDLPTLPTPPSGWGRISDDEDANIIPDAFAPLAAEPSVPDDLDLDNLIADLNSAGRMQPRPDLDSIPPPHLDDDIDDMVSPTMGRIFAAQGNADEAARVFERLAEQQPDRADEIRGDAARLFDRQATEQPDAADAFRAQAARLRALGYE